MSVADILGRMSLGDFHAQLFQVRSHFGFLLVRARNSKPQIRQHLGDAGHAYAADADEMYVLETTKHFFGAPTSCRRSAGILPAQRAKRAQALPHGQATAPLATASGPVSILPSNQLWLSPHHAGP